MSSSSAVDPAAGPPPPPWRLPGRRFCCWNAATICPGSGTTGTPRLSSARGKYVADETFYDIDDHTFHPELHYFVGGNSKVYGAALFRLAPHDFADVRHPGGIAPAWPLDYEDLEPYYVRAEHLYWVHGRHGEDPFAGHSSQDYRFPPVAHAPRIQELSDGLEKLGLHPFHLPIGVDLTQDAIGQPTPESKCIRCNRVDGFPCLVGAKADSEWAVVRPALAAHPNLTLMTRSRVAKLLTDDDGATVTGVVTAMADGSTTTFTADIVVLSAGSIMSSVLLLQSANAAHPTGLANSSDVVGRHYMRHNNLALMAFSKDRNPTVFQKTLSLNDFYGPSKAWEYPMGNIQMLGKSDDWQVKGQAPKGLGWAPNLRTGSSPTTPSTSGWPAKTSRCPTAESACAPDGTVKLAVQPDNNSEGLARLRHTFDSMLGDLHLQSKSFERSLYLHKAMDVSATAHQAGTIRFGTDPLTSALDINCKAHDLDNLYVVDGSFMPSIGAVNPTLTIIANALRVADHIAARLGATS